MTQITATVKKLRQLARACAQEAEWMEAAADLVGGDLHRKNARVWRGRSRTCWQAVTLLGRVAVKTRSAPHEGQKTTIKVRA